ncbi:MAG: nickel pincer cofactor biosynthesis protein LarB [Acidimicrobiales bacterium]
MDEPTLRKLAEDLRSGALTADEAVRRLRRLPYADLGFARVDHHRTLRQGVAEAVYAPGKTPRQCAAIVAELLAEPDGGPVLLTRADADQARSAMEQNPGGTLTPGDGGAPTSEPPSPSEEYAPLRRAALSTLVWRPRAPRPARVTLVTAGTADLPVAAECAATLGAYGLAPDLLVDCGVAGLHRLLGSVDSLAEADVVVVVAGMEGALASLVAGITPAPVVAVPTSVGYGAALEGVTALLAMLSSCAAGMVVVGIDNGFGAACAVARILR